MVRFIFICMGVVALSILTVAAQFMLDGIESAQQQVAARNDEAPAAEVVAVETTEPTAEDLNAIETAAGADAAIDAPGNQTFGKAFTSDTPKALKEPTPALETDIFPTEGAAQ